jgi:hypothetical protein
MTRKPGDSFVRTPSLYFQAKELESRGLYDLALERYEAAIRANEQMLSAVKDYAGILDMQSRTCDAVDFLEHFREHVNPDRAFFNLLHTLRRKLNSRSPPEDSILLLEFQISGSPAEYKQRLDSLFPKLRDIHPVSGRPQRFILEFRSAFLARQAFSNFRSRFARVAWSPSQDPRSLSDVAWRRAFDDGSREPSPITPR